MFYRIVANFPLHSSHVTAVYQNFISQQPQVQKRTTIKLESDISMSIISQISHICISMHFPSIQDRGNHSSHGWGDQVSFR